MMETSTAILDLDVDVHLDVFELLAAVGCDTADVVAQAPADRQCEELASVQPGTRAAGDARRSVDDDRVIACSTLSRLCARVGRTALLSP